MKKPALKGFAFLLLLTTTLVLSNQVYIHWFYRDDIAEADAKLLPELDSLQHVSDILYFAESSNATFSPDDTCRKSISELLGAHLPGRRINAIQHGAIHAATYLLLMQHIRPEARVKTIIITMNLRSFGAAWIHSPLETPLAKANVMYRQYPPIVRRLLLAFNGYDNRDEILRREARNKHWLHDKINLPADFPFQNITKWDAAMAKSERFRKPDGSRDMETIQLACNYVKCYGFTIDPLENPRVSDFDEIVRLAREKHLNLVFNLLAENVQYADSLVGKELPRLMRENRDLLVSRYSKQGVLVVDNLELVEGKDFADKVDVTEHYNQHGRQLIADNLAKKLALWLR